MIPTPKQIAAQWDRVYGDDDFVYGLTPNDFLRAVTANSRPSKPVKALLPGDGEGRNAVYLASLGYKTTSVDLSQIGMTKANCFAEVQGYQIETLVGDVLAEPWEDRKFELVVVCFLHMPGIEQNIEMLKTVTKALAPGGVFVFEGYHVDQPNYKTGGPPFDDWLFTVELISQSLTDLEIVINQEVERHVLEGAKHTGLAKTVQVLAQRPE